MSYYEDMKRDIINETREAINDNSNDHLDDDYHYMKWRRQIEADWQQADEREKEVINQFKKSITDGFKSTNSGASL